MYMVNTFLNVRTVFLKNNDMNIANHVKSNMPTFLKLVNS